MVETILLTLGLFTTFSLFLWMQDRQPTDPAQVEYRQRLLPAFPSTCLGNQRNIVILLPATYDAQSRHYPLLLVNDGQEAAQWDIQNTVERLVAQRQIPPIIVALVPANDDRLQEYGTAIAPNAQGMGKQADAYANFIKRELLPALYANFRIRSDSSVVGILGASLGGLSAFDIGWHNAQIGIVGVMSGSFWWRAAPNEATVTPNQLIAHQTVRRAHYQSDFRAWFEAGTADEEDDRDGNGVIDAIQDTVELIEELNHLGYENGAEIHYFQVEGGEHNYDTWAQALPAFLKWAYGRLA